MYVSTELFLELQNSIFEIYLKQAKWSSGAKLMHSLVSGINCFVQHVLKCLRMMKEYTKSGKGV
jgi:hypothetical protein